MITRQKFKDKTLLLAVTEEGNWKTTSFKEFSSNGDSFEFIIWDDIAIRAYIKDKSVNSIKFTIPLGHPLYFCFKHLLADSSKIIIDDDATVEQLEKYVVISKEESAFRINFVNNKVKESSYNTCKFGVFIKNIMPDSRSKITDISIKQRLIDFFQEVEEQLLEEYHQITFEEYFESQSQKLVKKL